MASLAQGKGHGLSIINQVSAATNGQIKLHMGNIYPMLRDMERRGILSSYEVDPSPDRGGRPRRYYELTAKGEREADETCQTISKLFGMEKNNNWKKR